MAEDAFIRCEALAKDYRMGAEVVHALKGVDLTIARGEFIAVLGPSGSGKSTLMNLIGALDRPSGGRLLIDGREVGSLSADALAHLRNHTIGFVFQQFNLLARTDAIGNVSLPLVYAGMGREERNRRALECLEMVGLADRAHHRPSQLSGGQQQRVAIARALVNKPQIILADEPTGALDTHTGEEIMELLTRLNREQDITVILVTHEPEIAEFAERMIYFRDGEIVEERRNGAAVRAASEQGG